MPKFERKKAQCDNYSQKEKWNGLPKIGFREADSIDGCFAHARGGAVFSRRRREKTAGISLHRAGAASAF
jgi:hypothetical protein